MKYKIKLINHSEKRYLFLDIDGVCNKFTDYENIGDDRHVLKSFLLNKNNIEILNQIVKIYNPTIVLSSFWRTVYQLNKIQKTFEQAGFIGKISSSTPKSGYEHEDRWKQIKQFIKTNKVHNFIILDDENLTANSDYKVPNFIKVDSYSGLGKKELKEINEIWKT